MKDMYKLLIFFSKVGLTYIILISPILIYLACKISYIGVDFLEYLGFVITMIILNFIMAFLLFRTISTALSRHDYKLLKERVIYSAILPTYILFIISLLFVRFNSSDIDKNIAWFLVFWGYGFGFILAVIRSVIVRIQRRNMPF